MSYPELAIHTFTTKPWSITECIENYARRGIGGISVWRETIAGLDLAKVRKQMDLEKNSFARDFTMAGLDADELAGEFGQSVRQIKRYLAGECQVPKLVLERMRELARDVRTLATVEGLTAHRASVELRMKGEG